MIVSYLILTLVLNASHWISDIAHFNSFGSMVATICFLIFIGTMVQMKTVRDRYEKKMELKQKRFEQRQMEQYMNKIQGLYLELKGFRHDFGNIITSLNLAIEEENIEDIKRIEAAKMSQEKEVQIAIFNMPNGVHLIIKNSISDEPINWNKLYEKGFSTKGDRRGMGLAIVKELIGEYAAIFLETELINGRFTQSLVIGEKGR